jgi:integrase
MKVIFSYGKANDPKSAIQNINIRVYHSQFDFRRTTGIQIQKKDWNFDKNQLANGLTGVRTPDERKYLRTADEHLKNIESIFSSEFLTLKLSHSLKSLNTAKWNSWCESTLSKALGTDGDSSEGEEVYLLTKFSEYIDFNKSDWSPNTIRGYNSTLELLKKFEEFRKHKYLTDEIDLVFYRELREWNIGKGRSDHYFGSVIQKIKAVINHFRSVDKNFPFHVNIDHKKFITIKVNPEHDILTEAELEKVFKYSGEKRYENVRDLIIIQYHSCLRYDELRSELSKGKDALDIYHDENGDYFWRILEGKTGKKNKLKKVIPVHKKILDLLPSANFPHLISSQKYNQYLKELITKLKIEKDITTHTIRRSFCTNMFNNGIDPQDIMQYSGHSEEKMLRNYIKVKNISRTNSIPTK